jgi:hypothetical protein
MTATKQIATDVWQVRGQPMRMPGGVYMPLASTVLGLADRSLLVYSPIPFTDQQAAAIDALGDVSHIVAPNLYHHLHARAAKERWPRAQLHGAPGLAAKRKQLTFDRELAGGALDATVDVEVVGGAPKINETLLFHRPSGTLVCADFLFNITEPVNLMSRVAFAMMGVGGRELRQSRLWRALARERGALRTSIDRVLGWPIQTISPVHGDPIAISAQTLAPRLTRSYGKQIQTALLVAG